jgi:photosystem II stability/assembly factor-like uncharacterized protein
MRAFPLPFSLLRRTIPLLAASVGFFSLIPAPLVAELTRFEILEREAFADGQSFGEVGAYERIKGRVHYELDPEALANRNVIDLKLAPRNEQGKVELSADLYILAPKELNKGNGALLYGVNNRGGLNALRHFNYAAGSNQPESAAHAGDGFLMRHGFTVVWSGWDGELLPGGDKLRLFPPKIEKPITGMVRCEIVPSGDTKRTVINWANHGSYRPTAEGLKNATLTHRLLAQHPRVPIPREKWKLVVTEVESANPAQLPKVELDIPDGLHKLHIYEVIYEAQDPLVMGTGFTAVRDLISSLKHGTGKNNPLLTDDGQAVIERAHSFGVSQSGRFLREFVYWDFNADENGRKVFDGIIPHVSGSGMGSFNHRFAQPTRHAGQHDHHDYPPDRFPFAYETQTDPLSGLSEGILDRAVKSGTAPLVMHTQSTSEYWNRSGSLVHTDPLGTTDAKIPDKVRLYFFGGTQHGPSGFTTEIGGGQTAPSPADYKPFVRSLLLALDRWAKDGTEPPPSVYPKISNGTLVAWTQNATGFPEIPGIRYPSVIQQPAYLDFGPRWQKQRIVDHQPPIARGDYRVLVPRAGPDGNELGCLSAPEAAVPVATYAGWRLRAADGPAANQLYSLSGSYIPFPVTRAERKKSGDPRGSVEELYGTLENYLRKLEAQCRKYEKAGYLLPEDTERTLKIQRERVAPIFEAIPGKEAAENKSEIELPKFAGPAPKLPRKISIPTVDISGDTDRHSIVARGTADTYHGHCDTALLPDGKTLFAAWTVDHAQLVGPLARSDDGGRTWSKPLDVPANWNQTANTPAIHRLVDSKGKARLVIFADGLDWRRQGKPPYPMHQAISEDDGKTWTAMKPNGVQGEVPPKTILSFDDGKRLVLWSDLPGYVVQSESKDGGQTWSREQKILQIPDRWGQPCVIRSPKKPQHLLMLLRENSRKHHSLYSISSDDAKTWSDPRELPAALTGDRHVARFAPDGRLVVAMRDMARTSATYGHYIAWVGRFEDIANGREGQYRIKLLHNHSRTDKDVPGSGNTDCGYSDLEVLPDGTILATTYVKYAAGPEKNSVVSVRFGLGEVDGLVKD